jgi:hypothetical protein
MEMAEMMEGRVLEQNERLSYLGLVLVMVHQSVEVGWCTKVDGRGI